METSEKGIPHIKKKPQRENRLTVIIMGKLGRQVRSFEISRKVLFWAAIFLLVYIPVTVIVINRYIDIRGSYLIESQIASHLEKQVANDEKRLLMSKERIAFLERYIRSLEGGGAEMPATENKQKPTLAPAASPAVGSRKYVKQAEAEAKPEAIVSIDDMVIQKQDSTIEVVFRLVNLKGGDNAVGGYIHIIGERGEPEGTRFWTFPHEKLAEGLPENYRRGQLFLIQRFKPVKGRLGPVSGTQFPSSVHIVVYDQSGNLLLQKRFEVPHDS